MSMNPTTARAFTELTVDNLFHRLWTKAVGAPDYVKAEWLELERRLALVFFRAPGYTPSGHLDMRLSPVAVERWQAGRTDVQMAQAASMTPKNWGVIRRGEAKDPPLSTYIRVCQALGCGFSDLLEPVASDNGLGRVTQVCHAEAQDLGETLSTLEARAADLPVDDLGEVVAVDLGSTRERGDGPLGDPACFVGDAEADGGTGRAHSQEGSTKGGARVKQG